MAFEFKPQKKKIEFGRLPVKPTGKPVKPTGKPVKPTGEPFGTGWTCDFEFDRFPPISTDFRSNQSGKPLPDRADLTGHVGLFNHGRDTQRRPRPVTLSVSAGRHYCRRLPRRSIRPFLQNSKILQNFTPHQIFKRIYEVLNIAKQYN